MLSKIINRNSLLVHLQVVSFIVIYVQNFSQLQVEAHGTMVDPVSRNSLWRLDGSAPVNYNDIELFCGGIGVSINQIRDTSKLSSTTLFNFFLPLSY